VIYWIDPDKTTTTGEGRTGAQTGGRVLLIEDDASFAESLRRLLTAQGHDVHHCASGESGLAVLGEREFDVVLIDLNLPDTHGHDVIRAIRAMELDAMLIVVSGETEIDAAILALRLGALDYVRKPLEPEILAHSVRRAIRQRQLMRDNANFQVRLSRSERLHRFLVERSPDIIFILDRDGRINYLNDRPQALLGLDKKQLLNRHFARMVHEHDRERARYAFSPRKLRETARHSVELRLRSALDAPGFRHFEIRLAAVNGVDGDDEDAAGAGAGELEMYYGVARDITARREVEELATFQANHDILTGLPNRNLFRDHLGLALVQARRNMERLAVLFLNIDRFKPINDLFGHARADELLCRVGERIQRCLRGSDTLARFVGDEFLVLNTGIKTDQEVMAIVARINQELEAPFHLAGRNVGVTISAGIATFPEHGDSAEALIRHANIALYHGRLKGGRSHTFFMPEMGEVTSQRLRLQSELRRAIDHAEFELYFQPQVDLLTRHINGVEALIRWNHPERGLLPPGDFLPLAEEAGLIGEIGEWVTRMVCAKLTAWEGEGIAPARVAINISPHHLDQTDFVERFMALLAERAVEPRRIEVELTENLFIRDPGAVAKKLQALAAHGVMIAIDDFGTQYSSLSYLQKFPIHTLKIDKSFVWEIDREYRQHAIIKAIISIAHGLGLNLIAEGVETDEQLRFLQTQGCDEIQGYLISKPLPAATLESLLRAQRARSVAAVAPQPRD
jgi:diguanylate cyclase (GGDEF)-like protein